MLALAAGVILGDALRKTGALNDLGKDGWELVAVTPSSLMIKGDYDSTYGYGGGETNGHFENDPCVFNKQF